MSRGQYISSDMVKIPKVALLIEVSQIAGRGLLRGIARYCRIHGRWQFYRPTLFYLAKSRERRKKLIWLQEKRVDGIIMYENGNNEDIIGLGLPCVVSFQTKKINQVPHMISDDDSAGRLAAKHFLDRGLKNFGYCGLKGFFWSHARGEGFEQAIVQAGFKVSIYNKSRSARAPLHEKDDQDKIADWLETLPKPVGVFACNDNMGRNVIEACQIAGLHVPGQVAVIGVDNDDLVCELTQPPLSSVALNFERSGYEAAELLSRLMAGEPMREQKIITQPIRVETRQSTDILTITDIDVLKAVQFIRQNAGCAIQVPDVVGQTCVARRELEIKFRRTMNRTIHDEIKQARADYIARMLTDTNLPISEIALKSGFGSVAHIARAFKREKGMGLREYRNRFGTK